MFVGIFDPRGAIGCRWNFRDTADKPCLRGSFEPKKNSLSEKARHRCRSIISKRMQIHSCLTFLSIVKMERGRSKHLSWRNNDQALPHQIHWHNPKLRIAFAGYCFKFDYRMKMSTCHPFQLRRVITFFRHIVCLVM